MNKQFNVLVLTTLYPNTIQFRHGIFVETRIKHLVQSGQANIKVIAPVPWFPCKSKLFPGYSKLVDIPTHEIRNGLEIYHPRYIVIPKIGMLLTPFFLAISFYLQIKYLRAQGYDFDVIDAHYYYPDGVAAALVAKYLNKPLMTTALGTDINLISEYSLPRKMIVWASKVACFNLAVCDALRQKMIAIGMDASSTQVLRNGVDLSLFRPLPRQELREKWQVTRRVLISIGNLIELKGHHLVIDALMFLPDYDLFIVGNGNWCDKLKLLVNRHCLQDRVRFLGEFPQSQLPELYSCADALVLASSSEGWANVLLEAMACGTPVVATNVSGTPEVVQHPDAGVLCSERSVKGIVEGVRHLFAHYPDREKTRQYAERFSWQETTDAQLSLLSQITEYR